RPLGPRRGLRLRGRPGHRPVAHRRPAAPAHRAAHRRRQHRRPAGRPEDRLHQRGRPAQRLHSPPAHRGRRLDRRAHRLHRLEPAPRGPRRRRRAARRHRRLHLVHRLELTPPRRTAPPPARPRNPTRYPHQARPPAGRPTTTCANPWRLTTMADRVTVIGWDGSPLTAAARSALGAATLVAGAAHHLALPEVPAGAERIRLGSLALAARRIAGHRGTAVVLADGDPGFFGVVRTLRAPEFGLEVEVVPAVSSVAAAFARAGMPWDDAQVVVAHPRTLRRAVNVCRAHTKVAVLTSPGAGPAELGLLMEGVHRTFVI